MSVPISPGVKFSQFANGGAPVVGDLAAGLRNGVDTLFDISASGVPSQLSITVNQPAHGLVVGNVVRLNGALYITALADTAVNAEAVGIVSVVTDANNFILLIGGVIAGLAGLTAGAVYFLSPTISGAITAVRPVTVGQIVKPLLVANTTTSGIWVNYLGQQI